MPPKNIIQSPFVTQRGLSIADVRSLAQNEPENFLQKIQTGAEAGTFRYRRFYLREFVLTTVILPPGVKNPGSVLLGLTPFPVDPAENSWRPKNELQYNEFCTF